MKRKLSALAVAAGVLILFASCSPGGEYIKADRATYDVIAPAHRAYIEGDATLSDEQKADRLRLLDSWDLRLRKYEDR